MVPPPSKGFNAVLDLVLIVATLIFLYALDRYAIGCERL
jgi:hypothetical protein